MSEAETETPQNQKSDAPKDVIEILLEEGQITDADADQAKRRQRRARCTIQDALVDLGVVPQEAIFKAVAKVEDLPYIVLSEHDLDPKVIDKVPRKVILRFKFVPISFSKGVLVAAFATPPSIRDVQQLRTLLSVQRINPVITTPAEIQTANKTLFGLGMETVVEIERNRTYYEGSDRSPFTDGGVQDLEADSEDATVGNLINLFLIEALQMNATDIHIEPFENDVQLRFRVDGMLREIPAPQGLRRLHNALISRVKVQANLNIAEQRLPHDGRMRVILRDEVFDLRVSIMPTRFGETLNMRILNRESIFLELTDLGLDKRDLRIMYKLLELPHGMVLVTGPTGSGKSTTLYASLDKCDKKQRKVITVEDPIEYQMDGISQIQINAPIGLTFARGLRSILRHDPDIVLVGEIRDHETAEIAIRSALTGHLVLSTLHTNDSVGAINRLVDMGVDPYLVGSSLSAAIAQRLVRRICKNCAEDVPDSEVPEHIRDEMATDLEVEKSTIKVRCGAGCSECGGTGYKGRVAIYEFFLMDENLEDMITRGSTSVELRDYARSKGMRNLRMNGWAKVQLGLTTIDEVLRITRAYDLRYDDKGSDSVADEPLPDTETTAPTAASNEALRTKLSQEELGRLRDELEHNDAEPLSLSPTPTREADHP